MVLGNTEVNLFTPFQIVGYHLSPKKMQMKKEKYKRAMLSLTKK
jgi:hypothetical protein